MGCTKNPLIPAPFLVSEVGLICDTKETSFKRRSIGFSEVPQLEKILTGHWKKLKKWIENQYPKNLWDRIVLEDH